MRRRLAAVAALVALTAGVTSLTATRSADASGPAVVGHLDRYGADVAAAFGVTDLKKSLEVAVDNGVAIQYPKLDRLYQLYNITAGPHAGAFALVERDRDSLKLLRTLFVPDRHGEMANGEGGAEWVTSFDNANDRLLVAYKATGGFGAAPNQAQGKNLPGVLTIDLATLAYKDSPFPRAMVEAAGGLGAILVGFEFDESTSTLLVLQAVWDGNSGVGNSLFLVGWPSSDLQKGTELPAVPPRPVRSCRRDAINNALNRYLTPILVAPGPDVDGDGTIKHWVVFPCYSTTFSANVVLARLDRSTALDPTSRQEKAIVAPAAINSWITDPTHGRLFLTNASGETNTWVYEVASSAFVGIVEMSPKGRNVSNVISLGIDESTGRLYARAEGNGLMMTPAAQDPVPQADIYPHLAAPGSYRILPDEKRSRIFSLTGTSTGSTNAAERYEIIKVPPANVAPPADDPDARTTQLDEEPGRTVAQYGGNASAYGLRVLLARGVSGGIPTNGNDTAAAVYKDVNTYCGYTDRELVIAGIPKTEMSDVSKFAVASAVELDSATVTDLKIPSRCDIYNSYGGGFFPLTAVFPFVQTVGVLTTADGRAPTPAAQPSTVVNSNIGPKTAWDYVPADCSRPGGTHAAGPNSATFAGVTKVDCGKANEIAAQAEGRLQPVAGAPLAVSVGRATSTTNVRLDPKDGLVSTSTSRVENIRIGEISIGYIANTATSYAKGRTGSARTVFNKPSIGFVEGPGIPACGAQCDVEQVLKQLNTAVTGRAEFRRPPPETRLAAGSPGGYEAGIIKSEKQKASDNSLSGDKSVEIPALELVVYNDNGVIGRARQVFQFAGVRVDSHYGIQEIGRDTGCLTCSLDVGTTIDELGSIVDLPTTDVAGSFDVGVDPVAPAGTGVKLPGPLQVIEPAVQLGGEVVEGVVAGFKLIVSNPRQAAAMGTAWLLLLGPIGASRRRRALKAVAAARPATATSTTAPTTTPATAPTEGPAS